jgi:hypothetical protein
MRCSAGAGRPRRGGGTRRVAAAILAVFAPAVAGAAPTSEVACAKMGGTVRFDVESERGAIVFTVTYPRNVASYLGGFVGGTKETGADVRFFLDLDANPATGMKGDPTFAPGAGGSEFSIETREIETSVAKDAAGEWIQKPVLAVMVQKQDEFFDLPEGVSPKWEMAVAGKYAPVDWMRVPDGRTMRLPFPYAAIGGKAGAKVRIAAVAPFCHAAPPFAGTAETAIVLK